MQRARVIADTLSPAGSRLTTMEVVIPRIVLAEFNTHRAFSRNSASTRAIPVAKGLAAVEANPYVPDRWLANSRGMSPVGEVPPDAAARAGEVYQRALAAAVAGAAELAALGVAKEIAGRLAEPYAWHTVVVTATEWGNFLGQRCAPDAARPLRLAAIAMRDALEGSEPRRVDALAVGSAALHLPFVGPDDAAPLAEAFGADAADPLLLAAISSARCARVSYLTHDGRRSVREDVALAVRLVTAGHMSPFEHAARPASVEDVAEALADVAGVAVDTARVNPAAWAFGNFRGWVQLRKNIPGEADASTGATRRLGMAAALERWAR
jgi:thymidylate synthase ThyX